MCRLILQIANRVLVPAAYYTFSTMDVVPRNLNNIPVDMVVCILKTVLAGGSFEDFFHCFMAWCQSQRRCVIIQLLRAYPLQELYKFSRVNSPNEVGYFFRFLFIVSRLEIPGARCFVPCKNLICGVGSIDAQLDSLLVLSNNGDFFSKLAWVAFQLLYNGGDSGFVRSRVRELFAYPHCRSCVLKMVPYLEFLAAGEPVNPLFISRIADMRCKTHLVTLSASEGDEVESVVNCDACNISVRSRYDCRRGGG